MNKEDILFPHDEIRNIQHEMIEAVKEAIENKKNTVIHAPTGLGKTAAALAPALAYAIKNNKTVFFLTSRHTQHLIAIETAREIKKKYDSKFQVVDIVGKKHMCLVPGIEQLSSYEFYEYCKKQREDGLCEFFNNTKKKDNSPAVKAKKAISDIEKQRALSTDELINICDKEELCPYELSMILAKKAKLIISDYYYIFSPTIMTSFFQKTERVLENSIVIVDEAHNLPQRARDLLTKKITTINIARAIKEAEKYDYKETKDILTKIMDTLNKLAVKITAREDEAYIKKQEFSSELEKIDDFMEIINNLEFIAEEVRKKQKQSYIGSIADFLLSWLGPDESFARILSKKKTRTNQELIMLSYRCLDPSVVTKEIINNTHSTILVSGTLAPVDMYSDLLGSDKENTIKKELPSPFSDKNKLSLIIPETTTKFTKRSPAQYKRIAEITADICNRVPGNTAIFFPSYYLLNEINNYFMTLCKKTTFTEAPGLTKEQRFEMLEKFKSYKDTGAVLLGVASGSFGEGIDLPGDLLKSVIVVGLPLNRPDLETKKLIEYYDKKFGKGWDYGYLFPAMTRCLQSAGRCIRSETDRGAIIFLDERFAWPTYKKFFPPEWNLLINRLYKGRLEEFFEKQ